jgi:hypothetical protein
MKLLSYYPKKTIDSPPRMTLMTTLTAPKHDNKSEFEMQGSLLQIDLQVVDVKFYGFK